MFDSFKAFFKSSENDVIHDFAGWRSGLWVIANNRIAILHKVGIPCEVHYVDSVSGETVAVENLPVTALRQARWIEIPEKRRLISEEKGKELGYGS